MIVLMQVKETGQSSMPLLDRFGAMPGRMGKLVCLDDFSPLSSDGLWSCIGSIRCNELSLWVDKVEVALVILGNTFALRCIGARLHVGCVLLCSLMQLQTG